MIENKWLNMKKKMSLPIPSPIVLLISFVLNILMETNRPFLLGKYENTRILVMGKNGKNTNNDE